MDSRFTVPISFWDGSHITVPDGLIPFILEDVWLYPRAQVHIGPCLMAITLLDDLGFEMHSKALILDIINDITLNLSRFAMDKGKARDCLTRCLQSLVVCDKKGLRPELVCGYHLLRKRAQLSSELGDGWTALKDLQLAKKLNPSQPEVWLGLMEQTLALGMWHMAFNVAVELLSRHHSLWDKWHVLFCAAVPAMVTALSNLSVSALKEIPGGQELYWVEDSRVWKEIVGAFYQENKYDELGIITVGLCDNFIGAKIPSVRIIRAASIPGIKFPDIDVGRILFHFNTRGIKKWHLKMGEFFIQRDADIHTISKKFNMPLLMAMVMLSLHADTPSFLELVWNKLEPHQFDEVDTNKETAYHYLARQMAKVENRRLTKTAEILCDQLLSHGCLPVLHNKDGKIAPGFLPKGSKLCLMMTNAIEQPFEGLVKRVKDLTSFGDKRKKNEEYKDAIALYEMVVGIQKSYRYGFEMEAAGPLLKLAIAYFKIGSFDKCHINAVKCCHVEKEFGEVSGKTFYWLAMSNEKIGKFGDAFIDYMEGYTHQKTKNDQLLMLKEGLKLLPKISGHENSFKISVAAFPQIWEMPDNWDQIVEVVNKNKMWSALKVFYLGPPYKAEDCRRGLLWDKRASEIDLHSVWEVLDEDSIPRLLLALLQRGANYNTLSSDPSEGFHAVVRFCALTNDTEVLKHVLGNQKSSSALVNKPDMNKMTPLHSLSQLKNKKITEDTLLKLAKMLCDAGGDVGLKDKDSKQAVDYARGKLKDWLKTKAAQKVKKEPPSKSSTAQSKQGATSVPKQNTSLSMQASESWQSLKELGNKVYEKKEYKNALEFYQQALDAMDKGKNKGSTRNRAVILGNMTECLIKMDKWNEAMLYALRCREADPTWFKAHLRFGRILHHAEKDGRFYPMIDETAFDSYLAAFNLIDEDQQEEKNQFMVLSEILSLDLIMLHGYVLRDMVDADVWVKMIHNCIVKGDWDKASITHKLMTKSPSKKHIHDLSFLCDKGKLKEHGKLMMEIMFTFMEAGSDISTLKFYQGDFYINALITIMVHIKEGTEFEFTSVDLFKAILYRTKRHWKDKQKACDDKGNTPLHHVALQKGNSEIRCSVAIILIRVGFDVFQPNKDRKRASELASKSDPIQKILEEETESRTKPSSKPPDVRKEREKQHKECDVCEDLMKRAMNLQTQRKFPQMYLNLVTVINENGHDSDTRHAQFQKTCIGRIADVLGSSEHPGIPRQLTKLCVDGLIELTKMLIQRKKLTQLQELISNFKTANSLINLEFLHQSLPLRNVILDKTLCAKENDRCKVVQFLIDNGAKLDHSSSAELVKQTMHAGCYKEWETPKLCRCFANLELSPSFKYDNKQIVLLLLNIGADPKGVTLTLGDTPLHAALRIALFKDTGNFSVFDWLTSSERKDQIPFDWDVKDKHGNNLLHLAAKSQFSHASMMAVERLCKNRVPVTVKNKDGKLPRDLLLNTSDRRAEFLLPKTNQNVSKKSTKGAQVKTRAESRRRDTSRSKSSSPPADKENKEVVQPKSPVKKVVSHKELRKEMKTILSNLPDINIELFPTSHEKQEEGINGEGNEDDDDDDEEEEEESAGDVEDTLPNLNITWSDEETETDGKSDKIGRQTTHSYNEDGDEDLLDATNIDSFPWEVECTEEVWNFLKNERKATKSRKMRKEDVSDSLKREIIGKIQQLAQGDWTMARAIDLEREPARLYRVNLSKGFILLEIAVAFSTKLNDAVGSKSASDPTYSEIIRVWNIVSTTAEAKQTLQKIILSHRRGKECYIKEKLDCKKYNLQSCDETSNIRYPLHYAAAQVSDQGSGQESLDRKKALTLCPPASTGKMEFHILKFYSFSSTLVSSIFNQNNLKVDFPFKVTPLEHRIISLPCASPVLLLGRSGTGKTTICLYRLWKKFLEYWEKERHEGQPLLVREWSVAEDEDATEEGACAPATNNSSSTHKQEVESDANTKQTSDLTESGHRQNLVEENAWMEKIPVDDGDDDDDDDGYHDREVNDDEEDDVGKKKTEDVSKEDPSEEDQNCVRSKRRVDYHHLHQVFVTKNQQLCSEVGKTFQRLRNSVHYLKDHRKFDDETLPNTLQDVEELAFPLFITSRQLLLLLDASLDGRPFFDRDENLDLKVNIPGWGTQEEIFHNIPLEGSSDEDLDDFDDMDGKGGGGGGGKDAKAHRRRQVHDFRASGAIPKRQANIKRECTYEVFAHDVWPRIAHKKVNEFHPSLVWTEIMSIIKGSYEALQTKTGFLTLEKYQEVGQKRAPNFSGDRDDVYTIFKNYLKYKRERRLFDEADLVFNMYTRLREMSFCKWVFDEIYVDELQDFTQAELALLIALSYEPNKMFLTGDTAQSIMHGISFRFKDLKSLFYFAKESQSKKDKGVRAIKPPKGVHPLKYNYRSHSGILSLASSVLDLLTKFFPESYDVMDRDQGLFNGPEPVLIKSCSQTDLALLLSGNQRKTSHIEFGAHQAILVRNQQAKENIPLDLQSAIVLTIYESKGLEFDDVLLYNFFGDSQASKTNEWRVVTDFLNELVDGKREEGRLDEFDAEILRKPGRPHPLTFNPIQHKILNTELKHLYTALTRARVNVWIFDEDEAKSAPVFEYFRVLRLVKAVGLGDEGQGLGDHLFTKRSTVKEWYAKAEMFMRRKLYEPAAKCFNMAQDHKMEKFASAHHLAQKASLQKQMPLYLEAGSVFVQCDHLHHASTCFLRAKENNLAALASEKNGEMKRAADQYKRMSKFIDSSRCYERGGMFDLAIAVLVDCKEFERALDCLHRYHNLIKECQQESKAVPQIVVDFRPRDCHSEKYLLYLLAEEYLTKDEEDMMFNTVVRLEDPEDQYHFLMDKGFTERAACILDKLGRTEDAAKLMLEENHFQDSLEYARKGRHVHTEATIHLTMAQIQLLPPDDSMFPSDCEDKMLKTRDSLQQCEKNARRASELFQETGDENGKGQALLVLGCLKKSKDLLNKAHRIFQNVKPPNVAGQIETFQELFALQPFKTLDLPECKKGLGMIRKGTQVMKILRNPTKEEEDRHLAFLTFYGFDFIPGSGMVTWNPNHYPLSRKRLSSLSLQDLQDSRKIHKEKSEVVDEIWNSLVADLTSWAATVGESLGTLSRNEYDYQSDASALNHLESLCLRVELNELEQTIMAYFSSDPFGGIKNVLPLLDFLPPVNQKMCLLDSPLVMKMLKRVRSSEILKRQISRYLLYKWDHPDRIESGESTDLIKERAKESDWLVQACLYESLFGLDINAEKKAHDLETDIMRLNKQWAKKSHKYAIIVLNNKEQQISVVESLGGKFITSFLFLVGTAKSTPDPYEAIFKFTKLVAVFGSRGEPSMMPTLEYLLFWLEFYVSLTFCFVGKSRQEDQETVFYLPASYFHHFDVVGACRKSHPGSILTDIVKHKSYLYTLGKRILERQNFIINFLVGQNRFSKFGLLDYVPTFCVSEDVKDHVAAERIIVLALVLLLNSGYGYVQVENRTRLLKSLLFKERTMEKMPEPLANLISNLPSVKGYGELRCLILEYLQVSRSESLMECYWQDQMSPPLQRRSFEKIEMSKMAPDSQQIEDFNYNNSALEEEVEEHGDTEDFEEIDEMERVELERQAQLRQQQLEEKMKACKIIVNFLRQCVLKSQQELAKNPYHQYEEKYLFAPYVLSSHRCGICGVDLVMTGGEDGRDGEGQTRETHEMSEKHQSAVNEFKTFKQVYSSKVLKDLMDISKFINDYEVNETSPIYSPIAIDVKKLLQELSAFHTNLKELMMRRDWSKNIRITATFNMVINTFQKFKKVIKNQYEYSKKQEIDRQARLDHAQAMRDDFVDESMDNIDLDPYDKPIHGIGGRGRRGPGDRGRGHRNRGGPRSGRR